MTHTGVSIWALPCCYTDPESSVSYGNGLAFLRLALKESPYCLMSTQMYFKCQCAYWLLLFMHASNLLNNSHHLLWSTTSITPRDSSNTGRSITTSVSIRDIYKWQNNLQTSGSSCVDVPEEERRWLLGSPARSGGPRVVCVTHGGARAVIYVRRSSRGLVCNEDEGRRATSRESRDPRWPRSIIHPLEYGAHQTLASFPPKKKRDNLFTLTPVLKRGAAETLETIKYFTRVPGGTPPAGSGMAKGWAQVPRWPEGRKEEKITSFHSSISKQVQTHKEKNVGSRSRTEWITGAWVQDWE